MVVTRSSREDFDEHGSRDRTLARLPGLDYTMAAEILFLIETLDSLST